MGGAEWLQEHTRCIKNRRVWPLDFTDLLQKDGEYSCLIPSTHTAQALPPPQLAGRCWAIGPNPFTIFPLSASLPPWLRGGQELTLDLQPQGLVWEALAPDWKGIF